MKRVETFTAVIFCGFRPGYKDPEPVDAFRIAEKICQDYCNRVGFAVTIEPTRFIYKNGNENGVKVGLINYPRFERKPIEIKNHALEIAYALKDEFKQERVSIVCSDETIMIGDPALAE